jgi:hypothetical protein
LTEQDTLGQWKGDWRFKHIQVEYIVPGGNASKSLVVNLDALSTLAEKRAYFVVAVDYPKT